VDLGNSRNLSRNNQAASSGALLLSARTIKTKGSAALVLIHLFLIFCPSSDTCNAYIQVRIHKLHKLLRLVSEHLGKAPIPVHQRLDLVRPNLKLSPRLLASDLLVRYFVTCRMSLLIFRGSGTFGSSNAPKPLFGSTAPASAPTQPGLFGQPPPAQANTTNNSLFAGGSLFGQGNNAQTQQGSSQPTGSKLLPDSA